MLTYGTVTATYNNRGRLATLANGGTSASYVYNALGQLAKQSGGPAGTRLYAYDDDGHLVGEYTSAGVLIQETVWLGDIPVATLRPSGGSVAIYYVHSDHLNTPRVVTRPSDNAVVWRWDSDPFGTQAANENPSSLGTFQYNLRFPGQIFDGVAGLHQNWNRDYSPAIGRYIQSDPIGLRGLNISTYGYALGNPVRLSRSEGPGSPEEFCTICSSETPHHVAAAACLTTSERARCARVKAGVIATSSDQTLPTRELRSVVPAVRQSIHRGKWMRTWWHAIAKAAIAESARIDPKTKSRLRRGVVSSRCGGDSLASFALDLQSCFRSGVWNLWGTS